MRKKGLENIPEPYRSLIRTLLEDLLRVFQDKLISLVVYGSVARGDYRRDSDIDLLVIIDGLPRSRFKRIDLFIKAEKRLDNMLDKLLDDGYAISISPIIKTPEEARKITPLYLDMVEDAVIIYDKDDFFENVLKRLEEKLKILGAKRVRIGKKWYWRLKRDYKFGEVINIE